MKESHQLVLYWFSTIAAVLWCKSAAGHNVTWSDNFIGGHPIEELSSGYFFIVAIQQYEVHRCTGSLVNSEVVLTACHCLADLAPGLLAAPLDQAMVQSNFEFVTGTVHLYPHDQFAQTRHAESFWVHPHCAFYDTVVYDIAVATMEKPFDTSQDIQPFNVFSTILSHYDASHDEMVAAQLHVEDSRYVCSVVGWGRGDHKHNTEFQLYEAKVHIESEIDCRKAYSRLRNDIFGPFDFDLFKQYCVISTEPIPWPGYVGASGSPLVCNGFIMGVHSYYLSDSGVPTIYQSFESIMSWLLFKQIRFCVRPGENCSLSSTVVDDPTAFKEPIGDLSPSAGNARKIIQMTLTVMILGTTYLL